MLLYEKNRTSDKEKKAPGDRNNDIDNSMIYIYHVTGCVTLYSQTRHPSVFLSYSRWHRPAQGKNRPSSQACWGMRVRNLAAEPHKKFYALAELGCVQLVGASSPPPGGNLDEPEHLRKETGSIPHRAPTVSPIATRRVPLNPILCAYRSITACHQHIIFRCAVKSNFCIQFAIARASSVPRRSKNSPSWENAEFLLFVLTCVQ